jgi:DNA modification methylase
MILKKTNAKIVLSSSWRKNTLEDTIKYMEKRGFRFCDKIVGVTIRAYHYIEKGIVFLYIN